MHLHELSCGFMSLYAVPFFVFSAHKNFTVLVKKMSLIESLSLLMDHLITLNDNHQFVNVIVINIKNLHVLKASAESQHAVESLPAPDKLDLH